MDRDEYRAALGALLGTAVDVSTWTTDLLDAGLRGALAHIDPWSVYEEDFEVTAAGQSQTVALDDLLGVVAVAYPWTAQSSWRQKFARWRWVAPNTIYFERERPAVGEVIRVRYTKRHTIEDLDGATATTVPAQYERALVYMAAAEALNIRQRQLSENPAVPREAAVQLAVIAAGWSATGSRIAALGDQNSGPVWAELGLE